jgi:D-alanyl-D-alanine carboxypeptidase/D-alanyl-D-alanine-endopeptidase (penicillin-binding protein 4)
VVVGAVCIGLSTRADLLPAAPSQTSSPPRLATPLWSARRIPGVLVTAVTLSNLQQHVARIVASYESCAAVDGPNGTLTRFNSIRPLAGASTQKLLTAATALAVLGAPYRFDTRATTAARLEHGTLEGDLSIVGGGDPVLSTSTAPSTPAAPNTPLAALADAIVHAGVHRVDGALVADDSRYDRARAVADWKPNYVPEGDVGALGALIVNGGRADNGIASTDPALDTVQRLALLLKARGVTIVGGASDPGRSSPPHERDVADVASPPLVQIVEQMLTVSNDETAELLTREVGRVRAGVGTTAAGTLEIPAVLAALGVPVQGVVLHDGSGLAPDDRITCASLLGVVSLATQARFSPITQGLAVAGQSGTLAGRLVGTALAGRLRAKTGHIDGVVGLAGVVDAAAPAGHPSRDDQLVRFAFLANGDFSTATGDTLQDQIAATIGDYLDAPSPVDLVPAPR